MGAKSNEPPAIARIIAAPDRLGLAFALQTGDTPPMRRRLVPIAPEAAGLCALLIASASLAQSPGDNVILVPNSLRDSVSVCAENGSFISLYYMYLAQGVALQPIQIIDSRRGTFLVTDLDARALLEYSREGVLLRSLAGPEHGVVSAYSVCIDAGMAYFTAPTTDPTQQNLIWRVPVDGSAPPSVFFNFSGLGVPRGIIRVQNASFDGFYVGDSDGDDIERITISGQALTPFHNSDGVSGIDFPQQLVLMPDGGVLAAGFTAPSGIYRYDASGAQLVYLPTVSPRGVHALPSGEYLYSAGVNLSAVDSESGAIRSIYAGQSADSFRFITPWRIPGGCPADLNGTGAIDGLDLAILLAQWGTNGSADLNGDGTVSGTDLTFILSAWGPC